MDQDSQGKRLSNEGTYYKRQNIHSTFDKKLNSPQNLNSKIYK